MRQTRLVLSTLLASALLLAPAVVEAAASRSLRCPPTCSASRSPAPPRRSGRSPTRRFRSTRTSRPTAPTRCTTTPTRLTPTRSAVRSAATCRCARRRTASRSAPRWASTPSSRIVGLCGGAPGLHDAVDRPHHARGDRLAGHARPRPHHRQQPAQRPVRRRVLLPRQVEPRLRADHDQRDLAGHHHRHRAEAHGDLLARDPRGRLHDRHDARLEEPDLLRHQGRPDRHRRLLDRGLQDQDLPRRGDLQLDGRRRDRRRLRGHRPPAAHPGGRQDRLPAGALVGGVRPRHPDRSRASSRRDRVRRPR